LSVVGSRRNAVRISPVLAVLLMLTLTGCATNTQSVDMNEPRRIVGTENDVRVDAQIFGEKLGASTSIPLKYDVTNDRSEAIAIADLIPEATYDPDTQTVTVSIGAEVPGAELLPRLIAIAPGEKKSFSTVARVNILVARAVTPNSRFPNALRLKINFLSDTAQFRELIAMPERAMYNPKLADQLFPTWLEKNETVYTNTVPMRWMFEPEADPPTAGRRRRRG